ncbi:MAG: Fe-S cluster assembly protein SufD [Gammaproteobacteria bacterium]|nr:Fe-S cluster assembly protein SufD [Gammaproteobacteria bacterium]
MTAALNQALDSLAGEFERVAATLPAADQRSVANHRTAAVDRLRARGLPVTRDEAWKYTDLKSLAGNRFRFTGPSATALTRQQLPALTAHPIVLVNGWLDPVLTDLDALPTGVSLSGLDQHLTALMQSRAPVDDAFQWLNDAFLGAGLHVNIDAGIAIDQPLEIICLRTATDEPAMCHPRLRLDIGAGASVTVLERYVDLAGAQALTNVVTDIVIGQTATVTHCRIQAESPASYHIGRTYVDLARDATYQATHFDIGAGLSRTDINIEQHSEGSVVGLDGLMFVDGKRHCDCHLNIDHAAPRTRSTVRYKGVIDDEGRGVFNGRILVRQDAQQISAQLHNRNLLLSARAEIDTKPELEIYADDVQCAHGATVGQLDETALFYLRSRGVPLATARALLLHAFVGDIVDAIADSKLRQLALTELAGLLAALEPLPELT